MTQEEKARAYDEALEQAKKELATCGSMDCDAARQIFRFFPELRESDDERIRKLLVWQVYRNIEDETNDLAQSVYDGIKGHDPDIEESIEDWKKCLAYLEKQKENPKSADSILSDCASDAKCEDRWHKVSDSLPDNPREVLCKDEAGNYFIGRYYTGEGWEISNYDDEDKPHHLNPPVSKWIDFPSEKQKEPENTSASTMAPSCWEVEQKEQKPKAKAKSPLSPHELYDAKIEGISQGRQDVLDHPEQFGLQKPAEWSEEDKDMLNCCISSVEEAKENRYAYNETDGNTSYDREIDWLESLRPSWKPSEEQMKALERASTNKYLSAKQFDILVSLYEQLKKL